MTRLCYLKCEVCSAESRRQKAEIALVSATVDAGWAVNRIDDKDVCPTCRARPSPDFWESKRPPLPAGPAAADLTWD